MNNKNKECCPKFNPEKWDQKTYNWNNKSFIKETMPTLFHIPCPSIINKKITKMCKMVENSKMGEINNEDVLMLFHDTSAFESEIYLSVTGNISGANNTTISGTFIGKVFSGPYNSVPKFIKQMNEYLLSKGNKAKDYYIHYAYCPECAKKYENNYMIIFAQI